MSSEERRKILQMVAEGRITAEEAAQLMRSFEESADEEIETIQVGSNPQSAERAAEEFDEIRTRAQRWAMIPLWTGVLFTVLSAWGMFSIQQNAGYNFWFFCLGLPLFLGLLLIVMGAGGGTSRWIYVNVDRTQATDWPRKITIALPLPLGLAGWFLNNFGGYIQGLKKTTVDEVLQAIAMTKSIREPLIVSVDDDQDGDRVQVYIG